MKPHPARLRCSALIRCCVALQAFAMVATPAVYAIDSPAPAASNAQDAFPVNEKLFQALQWRGIGPYRGGRARPVQQLSVSAELRDRASSPSGGARS
jgi:hypothetical protein